MLISILLVLVGLGFLNEGIRILTDPNGDTTVGIVYLLVTTFSFAFVMFSIVRVRRGYAVSFLAPSKVMSVVLCTKCTFKQIKNFAIGDYVFKMAGTCTQCGNSSLFINQIYSENDKKR